ncbi:MAG: hypothetical protein U9R42_13625 [Bacteroidota bacterium]|nr:hypothetical protein [Bacteroidota bacterium]
MIVLLNIPLILFLNINKCTAQSGFWHGNVLIPTTTEDQVGTEITKGEHEDYRLAVNGKIVSKSLIITENNWKDYVFNDNYYLIPLDKLEIFINKYKHLPDVPTTEEVNKNGVSVGEMNEILLQKVEELTLYILELNKEIDALKIGNKLINEKLNSNKF